MLHARKGRAQHPQLLLLLLSMATTATRSLHHVVCFDPADSTVCLEAGLAAPGATTVYLPPQPSSYLTSKPLWLAHSHREVVLAAGVVIEAKTGSFVGYTDCLLNVGSVTNVTVRGETPWQQPPAVLRMHKLEYVRH